MKVCPTTNEMEPHICRKCNVTCHSRAEMQEHYNCHFHNTNLIRLSNNNAALTYEEYEEIKQNFMDKEDVDVQFSITCNECNKTFLNENSYKTHCLSKKHKRSVARLAEENTPCEVCKEVFSSEDYYNRHARSLRHQMAVDLFEAQALIRANLAMQEDEDEVIEEEEEEDELAVEEVDSYNWDQEEADFSYEDDTEDGANSVKGKAIRPNICFLCRYRSPDLLSNLNHMEQIHSFVIPYKHACDLNGFITYLGKKVGIGYECIECTRWFGSLHCVQKHMLNKPHIAIKFKGEYKRFFDVNKIESCIQFPAQVPEEEYHEVVLPNGNVLTRRIMSRYFKQNLKEDSGVAVLDRSLRGSECKTIGHVGKMAAGPKSSKVQLKREMKRITRDNNAEQQRQCKKEVAVSVKANKLQPHFRLQVHNAG